jgi:uncharacterized protein (TIGR00255 family)
LPPGCEALETSVRNLVASRLKRGNLQINLAVSSSNKEAPPQINQALLADLVRVASELRAKNGGGAVNVEQLLQVRGVLEFVERAPDEATVKQRDAALIGGVEHALEQLVASRVAEGAKLKTVLVEQLDRINTLAIAARDCPARNLELQKKRLSESVAKLLDANGSLDPQRLHQEAVLLATKADIQEELDRLFAHIETARDYLVSGDAVGRKLDFLMQEFNREANTLCSKSPDASLTAIGLDLKTVIDQMREQVQNIE